MIQAERMCDKVLSSPDELLADRAKQWKKLLVKGTSNIGELKNQADGDQGG